MDDSYPEAPHVPQVPLITTLTAPSELPESRVHQAIQGVHTSFASAYDLVAFVAEATNLPWASVAMIISRHPEWVDDKIYDSKSNITAVN